MLRAALVALFLVSTCTLGAQEQDIVAMLQQSVADWNRADIPAFMRCYEGSGSVCF